MKLLYRVKDQYKDKWLDNWSVRHCNYNNEFFNDYVEDAHIFDSLEEIYELIDEHSLEVQIETIYIGNRVWN